jgi:hypothetical protein
MAYIHSPPGSFLSFVLQGMIRKCVRMYLDLRNLDSWVLSDQSIRKRSCEKLQLNSQINPGLAFEVIL